MPDAKTPLALTAEQARAHMMAGGDFAHKVLKLAADEVTNTKPYDAALGCYLACAGICHQFGWHPQDFHQWVAKEFAESARMPRTPPFHDGCHCLVVDNRISVQGACIVGDCNCRTMDGLSPQ